MVRDGTEGTSQGPGYVQYLDGGSAYAYTNCNLGNPYDAARAVRLSILVPPSEGSCSTCRSSHSTTLARAPLAVTFTAPATALHPTSTMSPTALSAGTATAPLKAPVASLPLGVSRQALYTLFAL